MRLYKLTLVLITMFICTNIIIAQGSIEDYRRAFSLKEKFNASKVFYSDVNPTWIGATHNFWYVRNTPKGRVYALVNADNKNRKNLFDHKLMTATLSEASGRKIKATSLYLEHLSVNNELDTLRFIFNNHRWRYITNKNQLMDEGVLPTPHKQRHWMETDDEKTAAPISSPNGKYMAFIKNHNIYVKEITTNKEKQLSLDGTPDNYYSSYIHWSPDSKKVASCKIRPAEKHYIYYVESSPCNQLRPKLHKQEYAKPGDELPFKIPCIYEIETGRSIIPSTNLFSQQYHITAPRWNKNSQAITFEYNQRGHQIYRILELSATTGKVRSLIEETSDKYVNYSRLFRHDLQDEKRIIWMSERDNWNHLYMYDRTTAQPIHQITKGEWYVRDVLHVDETNKIIYFSANGIQANEDPYLIRYYRIGFDGKNLTCLTPEEGMHNAWFSKDMKYLVDVYSMVNKAPIAVLRNAKNGKVIMPLEIADISRLETEGWKAPEIFTAKGRDGKTDMWGIIIRPTNFDPNKKYPILEYIYQGPGNQYVPKTFTPYNYFMSAIAELGFIVVMVDGMGTSFRSRTFENICYKNLKDAGLPDHITWIKSAAKKYPYMDIDRVGIYGCSAGGQESMTAVLFHPEFYKAAYSACGCHDNRMDKIWWNEQWLGYPIGVQYKEGSNVENAHLLNRPLMLVVGEMDDNVDPASTMQVVNALIKANKNFELVVIPGAHHTMGEKFGEHKRYDFFVYNLLHINPPQWNKIE
ncbi:MAG: DPP IV N-terminal domain-containing protein [Bacteroides xylanisolvens]